MPLHTRIGNKIVHSGNVNPHSLWRVDEDVEGAEAVEQGKEGDARRDLPDYVPDLLLDLGHVLSGFLLLNIDQCGKIELVPTTKFHSY